MKQETLVSFFNSPTLTDLLTLLESRVPDLASLFVELWILVRVQRLLCCSIKRTLLVSHSEQWRKSGRITYHQLIGA